MIWSFEQLQITRCSADVQERSVQRSTLPVLLKPHESTENRPGRDLTLFSFPLFNLFMAQKLHPCFLYHHCLTYCSGVWLLGATDDGQMVGGRRSAHCSAIKKSPAGLAWGIDFCNNCTRRDLQEKGQCRWRGPTCRAGGGDPS